MAGAVVRAPVMCPFDRFQQPGGRPLSRVSDGQTEISFFTQHVLCDGAGGTQFIGDWMRFYHNLVHCDEPQKGLKALDPKLLLKRSQLDLLSRQYLGQLWKQPLGIYGAAKFVGRQPIQLGANVQGLSDWNYQTQPLIISRWIAPAVSRKLKLRAQAAGVTVNSIFVAELFRTLHDQSPISIENHRRWLRVILPMSLRTFADRRMTSTNRATVVQIDRRPADFGRIDYLQAIDREIGIIRKWHLSKLFLLAMRSMSLVPGRLQRAARSDKCRGTIIFANLSEPFGRLGLPMENNDIRVGNLLLKTIDMAGPIRHRTPANFTFLKHLNRYRLSLHADPRVLTNQQVTELLDAFCDRMSTLVES